MRKLCTLTVILVRNLSARRRRLGRRRDGDASRVSPQAFQIVKLASFVREDVDQQIAVISQNPLGRLVAFHADGTVAVGLQLLLDGVTDRLDLADVRPRADQEVIGKRRDFTHVENPDVGCLSRFSGPDGN